MKRRFYDEEEYFDALYSRVTEGHCLKSYRQVLHLLHDYEFEYKIFMDKNRYSDGVDYRRRLGYERVKRGCSVLEMMIALAVRMEETIMDDASIGDRTSTWFWHMMRSMGLNEFDDKNYEEDICRDIIERFLSNNYDKNGKGGLFFIRHCNTDISKLEIWTQMSYYIDQL